MGKKAVVRSFLLVGGLVTLVAASSGCNCCGQKNPTPYKPPPTFGGKPAADTSAANNQGRTVGSGNAQLAGGDPGAWNTTPKGPGNNPPTDPVGRTTGMGVPDNHTTSSETGNWNNVSANTRSTGVPTPGTGTPGSVSTTSGPGGGVQGQQQFPSMPQQDPGMSPGSAQPPGPGMTINHYQSMGGSPAGSGRLNTDDGLSGTLPVSSPSTTTTLPPPPPLPTYGGSGRMSPEPFQQPAPTPLPPSGGVGAGLSRDTQTELPPVTASQVMAPPMMAPPPAPLPLPLSTPSGLPGH